MYKNKDELDVLVLTLVGSKELVDAWWNGDNKAFDNRTPLYTLEHEPILVHNYILRYFK